MRVHVATHRLWVVPCAICTTLQASWKSLNLTTPPQPSFPGRYLLPNATGDFDSLARVMASTHNLVDMWTTYGIIQAFTLVLLVARYASVLKRNQGVCA